MEFALVLVQPICGHMVWRVRGARCEVDEERRVRDAFLLPAYTAHGTTGKIFGECVGCLGCLGVDWGWFPLSALNNTIRLGPDKAVRYDEAVKILQIRDLFANNGTAQPRKLPKRSPRGTSRPGR